MISHPIRVRIISVLIKIPRVRRCVTRIDWRERSITPLSTFRTLGRKPRRERKLCLIVNNILFFLHYYGDGCVWNCVKIGEGERELVVLDRHLFQITKITLLLLCYFISELLHFHAIKIIFGCVYIKF